MKYILLALLLSECITFVGCMSAQARHDHAIIERLDADFNDALKLPIEDVYLFRSRVYAIWYDVRVAQGEE